MSTYVSATLRRQVIKRAGDCCEYCHFPQSVALLAFESKKDLAIRKEDCLF